MQAIETIYKGYRFRSRTEARWAVFFDHLGWEWQYEPEGFKLSCGWYLPDFYFPELDIFAEVKPPHTSDTDKCIELSKKPCRVILLDGVPDEKSYQSYEGGHPSLDLIFIPKGYKYYPFFFSDTFNPDYFDETLLAIHAARAARF